MPFFEEAFAFLSGLGSSAARAVTTVLSTSIGRTIAGITASLGLSLLADSLLNPKASSGAPAKEVAFTALIRSGTEPHRIFYGERLASGVVSFITTTGDSNEFLHIVFSVSGTQITDLGGTASQLENLQIILDDEVIGDTDAGGNVTSGLYSGKVRIKRHFGEYEQAADSDLVSESTEWTTNHKLRNRAYIYIRLEYDTTIFPSGIPNIQLIVRGRKLYDPRLSTTAITSIVTEQVTAPSHGRSVGDRVFIKGTSNAGNYGEYPVIGIISGDIFTVPLALLDGNSTGGTFTEMIYSDNAALVLADYLHMPFGLDTIESELNETELDTAADVCDEEVTLPSAVPTLDFTVDDVADNRLEQTVGAGLNPDWLHHLDGIEVSTTTTLPSGLSVSTRYFVYRLSKTKFHLCTTLANARAGTVINIADAGTGTHTLTRKSQPRYTIQAIISRDALPIKVIPDMLRAMFGTITYSQGEYHIFAGEYTGAATVTVDESYLREPMIVTPRPGIRNRFNAVRGTFVDRDNGYQNLEFIPIQDSTAESEDGQEIVSDTESKFVTDNLRAQRLAVLKLQRSRSGRIAELKCNMKAQRIAPHDIIALTIDLMSWSGKEFEVLTRKLASNGRGIDLICKEIFSTDFAYDPDADVTVPGLVGIVALPDATLAAPTNLTLSNQENEIRATWTDTPDASVLHYDIESKKSSDSTFVVRGTVGQGNELASILGVIDGTLYDVRIRAVNSRGQKSSYITVTDHLFGEGMGEGKSLFTWGDAGSGELGNGTTTPDLSSPAQVGGLTTWSSVSGGLNISASIKSIGTLHTWGRNIAGALGDNSTIDKSSPVQVGVLSDWDKVSAGGSFMLGIRSNGVLMSWGLGSSGRLGNGSTSSVSVPVQIGAFTSWSVISASLGAFSAAITASRTLYTWGFNSEGQLGDGSTSSRSAVTQVGALSDWIDVAAGQAHCIALKADGTIWSWGRNAEGQLGDGTTTPQSSPIQIGALTNWTAVYAGRRFSVALKIDGSLHVWGEGTSGQIGNGAASSVSSPVQVGTLTDWDRLSTGRDHWLAVKADNTLWACGSNVVGRLGDGTTTSRSSPVQIGALTTWSRVGAGEDHSIGLV